MKILESHDRLNRYNSIAQVLSVNRAVVAYSRELSFSTSKFCKVVEVIRKKQKEFNLEHRSGQLKTLKIKDELIIILSAVSGALYEFGKETGDPGLKNLSKCGPKGLFAMDENLLISKADETYRLSEKYCRDLKEYNIGKSSLQFLKSKTAEFKEALRENSSKYYFLNHSIVMLDRLFMQADEILKNIDGFVEVLSSNHLQFSRDYLNIRHSKNN
ncbi:MAG: hypothetical protein HF314_12445 [Ignavibacteria bacterium]|jgi:hypothetical protein|nr:hypothetical protein [Ignavibacteria bacterium]MCU7503882.1 hypothetical protein [Ignavibacteria bacterium]MCU7515897.1 hypothetical protein [Ignavibacteria bacterium]